MAILGTVRVAISWVLTVPWTSPQFWFNMALLLGADEDDLGNVHAGFKGQCCALE